MASPPEPLDTEAWPRSVSVRYDVPIVADEWILPEVPVPESVPHRTAVELLAALLSAWVTRSGRDALVARNLAVRWNEERPKIGIDPDVCLIEPAPPEADELQSLLLWKEGHPRPSLGVEVVSRNHPYKDYDVAPDKYAAAGIGELWVFDPELVGPHKRGGPYRLQLWQRTKDRAFERAYAGDGPLFSRTLGAWVFASDAGRKLRIADDQACAELWFTAEETERAAAQAERAAAQAERAAAQAERAASEVALRRVAELEVELARRRE